MNNYLPVELGVAMKEQYGIIEDLLYSPPNEYEIFIGNSAYCTEYYTWGKRGVVDPVPLRLVAFTERPMDWRTQSQEPRYDSNYNMVYPGCSRAYDATYMLDQNRSSLMKGDEEINHIWLGGYIYKDGRLAHKLYNKALVDGSRRHNGQKIKLAKYFEQDSWTEFKKSSEFKTYLGVTITNVTA